MYIQFLYCMRLFVNFFATLSRQLYVFAFFAVRKYARFFKTISSSEIFFRLLARHILIININYNSCDNTCKFIWLKISIFLPFSFGVFWELWTEKIERVTVLFPNIKIKICNSYSLRNIWIFPWFKGAIRFIGNKNINIISMVLKIHFNLFITYFYS